jgi:hypothetical protein
LFREKWPIGESRCPDSVRWCWRRRRLLIFRSQNIMSYNLIYIHTASEIGFHS